MTLLIIIGAIGLFLYAMQLISESLQKIAGDHLRHVQSAMTGNALSCMLTGLGVTALVQSSSAVTMMAVSYANTGLITLAQSMAVIMGANVGTTITAWIVAALGFSYSISLWTFPIIALTIPLFSSRRGRMLSWGEFIIGFALLFVSICFLRDSFQHLDVSWLIQGLSGDGIVPVLYATLTLLAGLLFTVAVRSSSAAFIIIVLMCVGGLCSFEMGCALIVCANIGTCIPPLFAACKGNVLARRAAMQHLLFNFIGMFWAAAVLLIAPWLISRCCELIGLGDPHNNESIPLCLALFHTAFNLITMFLLLPFRNQLLRWVSGSVHEKEDEDEQSFKLLYISSGMISPGEMALSQVQKETFRYCAETYKMFGMLRSMLSEPLGSERQLLLNDKIHEMEEESDRAEVEIANYLNRISPNSLSWQGEQFSRNLYKIVDELESIADSIYHMSVTLYSKSEQRVRFSKDLNDNVCKMFDLTDAALQQMLHVLDLDDVPNSALNKSYNIEDEINNFRNHFRNSVLDQFDRKEVEYLQSTFFMMLINECEKIGDYVINVVNAAAER